MTDEELNLNHTELPDPILMLKNLTSLFQLSVLLLICALIPGLGSSALAQAFGRMLNIATVLANLAIAIILIRMGAVHKTYKTAGIMILAARFCSYTTTFILPYMLAILNSGVFTANALVYSLMMTGLSLAFIVLYFIGIYKLYGTHADIISGIDSGLSEKWRKLFILAVVLELVYPLVNLGVALFSSSVGISTGWMDIIFYYVFNIPVIALECVYLNVMIKHFRNIILQN